MVVEHVLTVCAGNICRSPAALYLLRQQRPELHITSAGLAALVGHPISPSVAQLLAERGIDSSDHRAQPLTEVQVRQAQLILVAELRHKQHIERLYPYARGKVFRICEAQHTDVPDPHRQPLAFHQHSLALTEQGVNAWVRHLDTLGHRDTPTHS